MRFWAAAVLLAGVWPATLGAVQPPPAGRQAMPPATPVPTREVVAALIDALKDADYEVRYYVATALSTLGSDAVEPLIRALEDKSATTRSAAAYALGQLGPGAAPATAALLKALKDTDTDVRRNAALALGRIIASVRANALVAEPALPPLPPPTAPPPNFPDVRPPRP
jgi:HEAT repeat protein